jgi:hypothetical protein
VKKLLVLVALSVIATATPAFAKHDHCKKHCGDPGSPSPAPELAIGIPAALAAAGAFAFTRIKRKRKD